MAVYFWIVLTLVAGLFVFAGMVRRLKPLREDSSRVKDRTLYRWNQIDPSSAVVLRWPVTVLCTWLALQFLRSHPFIALNTGWCMGALLGCAIPPRPSLRRLVLTRLAFLAIVNLLLNIFYRGKV